MNNQSFCCLLEWKGTNFGVEKMTKYTFLFLNDKKDTNKFCAIVFWILLSIHLIT